jgi:hypothetical protein
VPTQPAYSGRDMENARRGPEKRWRAVYLGSAGLEAACGAEVRTESLCVGTHRPTHRVRSRRPD